MNLLAEEKLQWTVPASAHARKLYRELKELSDRQTARRKAILEQLPRLQQYRLTFVSVTMREEALRETLLSDVRAWFEQEYGINPLDFNVWFLDTYLRERKSSVEYPAGDGKPRAEMMAVYNTLRDIASWATVMACLRRVEQRTVPMAEADAPEPWLEIEVPAAWKNFHSFLDVFPRALFTQATEICDDLNPGVWAVPMDDDAKNFGGVNVHG